MARTIAEILAYKRNYSPELNPNIFDEDGQMYSEVRDKILEIVDAFLDYTQIKEDVKVSDIRVVGSNASYNYNENSDLDVHIVTDLSKISKPETIAQLYFGEVKHAFKEAYDIKIKGIEVELYVEDVNASAVTNGIYSVMQDKWIKEPEVLDDPTDDELDRAEEIEEDILRKLENASPDEKEDIIDQLYVMRKDALASEGETAPANLAFKSLRNKGILTRAKDDIKKHVSKKLSLECKKLKEDLDQVLTLADKGELIEYLESHKIEPYKEYIVCTKDGYDCYVTWSYKKVINPIRKPIVMLTYNGDIIFREEGEGDLFSHAISKLKGLSESKRIREMSRKQNQYWIYTADYSRLKKDERERSEFLDDSDNTSAYGPDDLIYKLNQLKDMNIKVKKIYQTYADGTSKNVTERFRRYLI